MRLVSIPLIKHNIMTIHATYSSFTMRTLLLILLSVQPLLGFADTIEQFINISNSIPTMEMKADPQAQAWARSARNVLTITTESIAEALIEANQLASAQGKPLFCLPETVSLNAQTMKTLIENAYQNTPEIQSQKNQLSVSKVAWLAVLKSYPCSAARSSTMKTAFTSSTLPLGPTNTKMQHVD
jgi:hypothetical protein